MIEDILPATVSLASQFTNLERVYPNDPRLLYAYDTENCPCILAAEPLQSLRVARFTSEAERDAWLGEVKASAAQRQRRDSEGGGGGGSAAPAAVAAWRVN